MATKIKTTAVCYSDKLISDAKKRKDINFESDQWEFTDTFRSQKSTLTFKNRFGGYKDIVKAWSLMRLDSGCSFIAERILLRHLANIFADTEGLTDVSIETILGKSRGSWRPRAQAFASFAQFIREFDDEQKAIVTYMNNRGQMRTLAELDSWIKMDYVVDTFLKTATKKELRLYFPIVIWWKFATLIPMRPQELCMMRKDNAVYMEDGKPFATVATGKNLRDRAPSYEAMPITKELYDLFTRYLDMTKDDREFLFSEVCFRELQGGSDRVWVKEVSVEVLNTILEKFYANIVEKKMGIKVIDKKDKNNNTDDDDVIERINLGDLRPYAMYNMMAQGFDPYSIKRMARHKHMSTQTQYYPNLLNMSLGKIHAMARRIKMRTESAMYIQIGDPLNERQLLARQLMNDGGLKMKNGECCNHMKCPPDTKCTFCQYYSPYDQTECKKEYEQEIKQLETCIDTMIAIYKERGGRYEALSCLSKEMNAHICKAAMLEARSGGTEKEI